MAPCSFDCYPVPRVMIWQPLLGPRICNTAIDPHGVFGTEAKKNDDGTFTVKWDDPDGGPEESNVQPKDAMQTAFEGPSYWVAGKDLKISYHSSKNILVTLYPYNGKLISS